MGAEITVCASNLRSKNDEETINPLEAMAKSQHISQRETNIKDAHRSETYQKRKSSIQQYIERKRRKRRQSNKILPIEQELDATEIQIRAQKHEIKLLKKQNEYLRRTNEQFLTKYDAYFVSNSKHSNTPSERSMSIDDSVSITNTSISYSGQSLITTQTNITENSTKISILSPLTPLTPENVSIIMEFSNSGTSSIPDAISQNAEKSVCSFEMFLFLFLYAWKRFDLRVRHSLMTQC